MSSAHTSTRRVVLNGAWLRHQAKSAIVTYLSPLTGGIGDKDNLALSNPSTTKASDQPAQPSQSSADQILYNLELLLAQKELSDSIAPVSSNLTDNYMTFETNRPEKQSAGTTEDTLTSHVGTEKRLDIPAIAKKDR
jgi:hypothetical protein